MGQAPRELTPWKSARHFFGAQLRHWRMVRGLSQVALGERTHDSGALIGKVEKGERCAGLALARRLDEALDTGGALERLWPQLERERAARPTPGGSSSAGSERGIGDLGLVWSPTPEAAVTLLGRLWRSELERRSVFAVAWVASAFAGPVRAWLLDRRDADLHRQAGRPVGRGDVDALWMMFWAFSDAQGRWGGYARSTLVHYLDEVVFPMLQGSYSDTVGRELMAVTAQLCNVCAIMSFDCGQHGLAQRYWIQALRLAQASGNRALGALILGTMSQQAHHLGDAAQALELADAGYRTGLQGGSPSITARCAALQGGAYALSGDQRACATACAVAERALDRAVPADEPDWIRFFTPEKLSAEMMYMASDLGRQHDVQRLGADAIASAGAERPRVLRTAVLAASYLPSESNSGGDADRAAELLCQVIHTLGSVHSTVVLHRVNSVRRALAAHASRPSVQELEHLYRTSVTAPGAHREP